MRVYTADEVIELLQVAGYSVEKQYGIRCVNDYIPDNDLKADPAFFSQLEQLEIAMSGKYPYYLLARYFHIIARKTTHGTGSNR